MVDTYGRWTYEPNTAENEKSWFDRIADWVRSTKYTIETTIENVAIMITAHWEGKMEDREEQEDTIENCIEYVIDSGGIGEFDYWC